MRKLIAVVGRLVESGQARADRYVSENNRIVEAVNARRHKEEEALAEWRNTQHGEISAYNQVINAFRSKIADFAAIREGMRPPFENRESMADLVSAARELLGSDQAADLEATLEAILGSEIPIDATAISELEDVAEVSIEDLDQLEELDELVAIEREESAPAA